MADQFSDFSLPVPHGDNYQATVTVSVAGVVQDISAWPSFRFSVKRRKGDPDDAAVAILTLGSGITVTNGPGGQILIELLPANTSALENVHQLFYADVQGRDASGRIWTVARGQVELLPDISIATT